MFFKKHKIIAFSFLIILILFILSTISLIWSNNILTYSTYEIKTDKIKNQVSFVVISDSEGKTFGKNNSRLIEKIQNANPEFVVILGDMVDKSSGDYTDTVKLCKSLVKKYPVFYTLGNHENQDYNYKYTISKSYRERFVSAIKETGANILVNEMTDYTTKKGDTITIAGLKQFPFFEYDAPEYDNEENQLFQKYLAQEDNSHFSILLCHTPEAYMWGLDQYSIDLMLSGHTHGGIVRLPFLGGLYAPEQGWFPQYSKGYYSNGKANMLITAGLGSSRQIPRFNNPPDVTVVNIIK